MSSPSSPLSRPRRWPRCWSAAGTQLRSVMVLPDQPARSSRSGCGAGRKRCGSRYLTPICGCRGSAARGRTMRVGGGSTWSTSWRAGGGPGRPGTARRSGSRCPSGRVREAAEPGQPCVEAAHMARTIRQNPTITRTKWRPVTLSPRRRRTRVQPKATRTPRNTSSITPAATAASDRSQYLPLAYGAPPTSPSLFTAAPSLVARSSLLSSGTAAPLRLAPLVTEHKAVRGLGLGVPFEWNRSRGQPVRAPDRIAELAQHGHLPVERLDPVLDELRGPGPLAWADGPAQGQPGQAVGFPQPEPGVLGPPPRPDGSPFPARNTPGARRWCGAVRAGC